jgi:hypothetical protein
VPGNNTVPRTAWSASHEWVLSEMRPVNTTPLSGSSTAVPSNGCPVARSPIVLMSVEAAGANQKGWCWKG